MADNRSHAEKTSERYAQIRAEREAAREARNTEMQGPEREGVLDRFRRRANQVNLDAPELSEEEYQANVEQSDRQTREAEAFSMFGPIEPKIGGRVVHGPGFADPEVIPDPATEVEASPESEVLPPIPHKTEELTPEEEVGGATLVRRTVSGYGIGKTGERLILFTGQNGRPGGIEQAFATTPSDLLNAAEKETAADMEKLAISLKSVTENMAKDGHSDRAISYLERLVANKAGFFTDEDIRLARDSVAKSFLSDVLQVDLDTLADRDDVDQLDAGKIQMIKSSGNMIEELASTPGIDGEDAAILVGMKDMGFFDGLSDTGKAKAVDSVLDVISDGEALNYAKESQSITLRRAQDIDEIDDRTQRDLTSLSLKFQMGLAGGKPSEQAYADFAQGVDKMLHGRRIDTAKEREVAGIVARGAVSRLKAPMAKRVHQLYSTGDKEGAEAVLLDEFLLGHIKENWAPVLENADGFSRRSALQYINELTKVAKTRDMKAFKENFPEVYTLASEITYKYNEGLSAQQRLEIANSPLTQLETQLRDVIEVDPDTGKKKYGPIDLEKLSGVMDYIEVTNVAGDKVIKQVPMDSTQHVAMAEQIFLSKNEKMRTSPDIRTRRVFEERAGKYTLLKEYASQREWAVLGSKVVRESSPDIAFLPKWLEGPSMRDRAEASAKKEGKAFDGAAYDQTRLAPVRKEVMEVTDNITDPEQKLDATYKIFKKHGLDFDKLSEDQQRDLVDAFEPAKKE